MGEIDLFQNGGSLTEEPEFHLLFEEEEERDKKILQHKAWLQRIRHERPVTAHPFKVGVYIRYWNQTKHENYLTYHKKQFTDSIALCPKWTLVDFYVDEGSTPPKMEKAAEWNRLVEDCMDGKVDLIITQKVSNVSKDISEVTLCARLLAAQPHPIGIYFVSEDIYSLASYYQEDLRDFFFLPEEKTLDDSALGGMLHD